MPQTAAHTPSQPRSSFIAIALASTLLLGFAAGGVWAVSQVLMAPSTVPAYMAVEDTKDHASLSSNTHAQQLRISASGPIWREITKNQREVLMPLRERWDSMGALTKRRWLVLADRYPQMDASERTKLVSRMNTWASLSAQQRSQARLNFESAKRLSAQELQEKWDAYQALSDAEKKRLAEQAKKSKTAKKAKRRLARIPKPKPQAAPQLSPSAAANPISGIATSHAVPQASVTVTQPVLTPQAVPTQHIAPLEMPLSHVVPVIDVSTQPVMVPHAAPSIDLPPLEAVTPEKKASDAGHETTAPSLTPASLPALSTPQ